MARRISELYGVGPFSERALAEIDIHTEDDLRDLGIVEAYARLKMVHGRAITLNFLWGLESALTGVHWKDISPERKAELKRQLSTPAT